MKYADGKTMHQFFQALFEAWTAVAAVEEEVHTASGLTGAQKKNLAHLLSGGAMTISDLAYARGVSRQSVQVTISTLLDLKYVQQNDNPRHKQAKLLTVTDKGRERLLKSEEAEHALIEYLFSQMKEDEVLIATDLLKEIKSTLDQKEQKVSVTTR